MAKKKKSNFSLEDVPYKRLSASFLQRDGSMSKKGKKVEKIFFFFNKGNVAIHPFLIFFRVIC